MAEVIRAAQRALTSEPAEVPALRGAVSQAARAAGAAGLRPEALLGALDAALARALGDDGHDIDRLRAAIAALLLRTHLGEHDVTD